MTKQFVISSTEKLLERIRQDQSSAKFRPMARSITSVDTGRKGVEVKDLSLDLLQMVWLLPLSRYDASASRKNTKDAEKKRLQEKRRTLFSFS